MKKLSDFRVLTSVAMPLPGQAADPTWAAPYDVVDKAPPLSYRMTILIDQRRFAWLTVGDLSLLLDADAPQRAEELLQEHAELMSGWQRAGHCQVVETDALRTEVLLSVPVGLSAFLGLARVWWGPDLANQVWMAARQAASSSGRRRQ